MLDANERKAKMLEMHNNGATYEQIGKAFNLSRQRAFQILNPKSEIDELKEEYERLKLEYAGFEAATMYASRMLRVKIASEIFANIHQEIKKALESNYKARKERNEDRRWSRINDDFINTVNGKIAALRGIEDFVTELEKEFVKGE